MKNHEIDFIHLGGRIQELFYDYVAVQSITNTPAERGVEEFFQKYIRGIEYFSQNPEYWASIPLRMTAWTGTSAGRWCGARGSGP